MVITFSNNPIDKFSVWLMNIHEKFTHYLFNRKPQYVKCIICGEILSSKEKETPSPEECGWRTIGHNRGWICHRCDAHRNFKPYIKLVDLDEEVKWLYPINPKYPIVDVMVERKSIFDDASKELLDYVTEKEN